MKSSDNVEHDLVVTNLALRYYAEVKLLKEIRACDICIDLPCGPKPLLQFSRSSKILIIGQAPGAEAHHTGIPWNDASGRRLREWLAIPPALFYDAKTTAIVPMGFCYPGKGEKGDLPPRKECQVRWMDTIMHELKKVELTVLIGRHAINHHQGKEDLESLIRNLAGDTICLPHPSPLNNIWLSKNRWFEKEMVPLIQDKVRSTLLAA